MIVVIDDERTFQADKEVIYLRDQDAAILFFAKLWNDNLSAPLGAQQVIDEVWFDHDLGEGGGNGLAVAELFANLSSSYFDMTDGKILARSVLVHSQNPVGADSIYRLLKSRLTHLGTDVLRVPLPPLAGQGDD